jgi:hypothetical protein
MEGGKREEGRRGEGKSQDVGNQYTHKENLCYAFDEN